VLTEDRVIEILNRSNPVPEEISSDRSATRYLVELQTRSSEMRTIEKREAESPVPGGPNGWKWLAAAVLIAVLATAGIVLLTTAEDEPTVATTPQVEEDPVPTTRQVEEDPVPSTEAVDEDEPTPPTSAPDAEALGVTGLPIFTGQPSAGDYEAVADDLSIVFTSDGSWKDCVKPTCDNRGGVEMQPQELLSVFGWIEPTPMSTDEFRTMFTATSGLLVGEVESFSPTNADAGWTGSSFVVDVEPTAGRSSTCESGGLDGPPYPCIVVEAFERFWLDRDSGDTLSFAIHGPTQFHVLTKPDGTNVWAAAIWFPYPQAPEGSYESMNDRFSELVQTIRFID